MSAAIFNREEFKHPDDGWYMIEPKGEHLNQQSNVVQVVDDAACSAIVNRFNADAAAGKLSHGREMLVDREHFKDFPDKESKAEAWLYQLQARPDGIYGKLRWTTSGQAAVDGGEYRFFSTEYSPNDLKVLNNGSPARVRPTRLDGLSLTNMPNNKGGKPITNRDVISRQAALSGHISHAVQNRAAERIAQLAKEEERLTGQPWKQCWHVVMNREQVLTALACGTRPKGLSSARETLPDAADYAARELLRRAQNRKGPGFHANLKTVQNRFPHLTKLANREATWDCLADLEPKAHEAFLQMVNQPREDALPLWRWTDFLGLVDLVSQEFPGLSDEGKWQKVKELYPASFLKFVLSFETDDSPEDIEKDQQSQDKNQRKLISMAASDEQNSPRNYITVDRLKKDAVSRAMSHL